MGSRLESAMMKSSTKLLIFTILFQFSWSVPLNPKSLLDEIHSQTGSQDANIQPAGGSGLALEQLLQLYSSGNSIPVATTTKSVVTTTATTITTTKKPIDVITDVTLNCRFKKHTEAKDAATCSNLKSSKLEIAYCYWDGSACFCPRSKLDCNENIVKQCVWLDKSTGTVDHLVGKCIHKTELIYNKLYEKMVIRGKKKLALQIFYNSNQAQTHAPHGIYGPISVDAVYPYLQFGKPTHPQIPYYNSYAQMGSNYHGGYGQYGMPTYGSYGSGPYGPEPEPETYGTQEMPTYGGYGQYGIPTYGGYGQYGIPTYGGYGQLPAYGGYSEYKEPKPEEPVTEPEPEEYGPHGGYGQYGVPTHGGYGQYGVPTHGGYGQYGIPTYGGYGQFGVPTYGEYGQLPAYGGYSDYKEPKPEEPVGCPDICPLNHDPVCGSDGETYANDCALTVWKCNHGPSDLKIVHLGKCGSGYHGYSEYTQGPGSGYHGYGEYTQGPYGGYDDHIYGGYNKIGYGNPTYGPPPSYGGYKPQNSYSGFNTKNL